MNKITVTRENTTGRNTNFHDNVTGANMTRAQFVKEIKRGNYPDYHIRKVNGLDTPASNPDKSKRNNLG